MTAKFIPIGDPAHDAERQALRYLVENLPPDFTVYGNAWIVERNGAIYELDAVVVAPHAIFVVEVKSFRGKVDGTDHDWYVPHPIQSPLKLNRLTAQVLKSALKRESYAAGQVWIEGLVFLSLASDMRIVGAASRDRVHTRKTVISALKDVALLERLSGRRSLPPASAADKELLRLLTGAPAGRRPMRRVREYEIVRTLEQQEAFTELLARNTLSAAERVLRVYNIPTLATDAQRDRIAERARWEAQVLARLGKIEGILAADAPFTDEPGIVIPLEHFPGITLTTWIEKYARPDKGRDKATLHDRTNVWIRIAETLDEAHRQGVVHRLVRPEVVLVQDNGTPTDIRVTGFDLAKQLAVDTTVAITHLGDDRLAFAAPEVVSAFSSAEPASDQFSLGALLALLLTGKPLFENTRSLVAARRLMRHVRDADPRIPLSLDEAVTRMLELRPTDRYPSIRDAIEAVRLGREKDARGLPGIALTPSAPLDPENLPPGARVGTDYEIVRPLGHGGMAVVYAARHLVSGRTRALKIARATAAAEEALTGEYTVLSSLDDPSIVKVIDLTKMVEGRLTLVMERVGETNLRQWLAAHPTPEPAAQRRLAEDLLAGVAYLEQRSVTHKDLKPDNLLVSDGRLTLIDFSLASMPDDALYGGTALYRDPASVRWTHATDRFAAALCLFELYAGRHAFDGHAPEPGQAPTVREDDIEPPGLAEFFRKALDPVPDRRFPSAPAMREALLRALGDDGPAAGKSVPPPAQIDATTKLRMAGLSQRAVNALARSRVYTTGELLGLPASQIRAIHAIGTKTAAEILAFQQALVARGLTPPAHVAAQTDPPLVADLVDSPEPVQALALQPGLLTALERARLATVGSVAGLTRAQLLEVDGIGRKSLSVVVEALHKFRTRSGDDADGIHTLDRLWELVSRPLTDAQRPVVERSVGIFSEPASQSEIADDVKKSQPQISVDLSRGIERLDANLLTDWHTALDTVLDSFGGIARLDEVAGRFEEEWPAGVVTGAGIVRLLVRVSSGRSHIVEVDGVEGPVVARPIFDREALRAFTAKVVSVAEQWPPVEPDAARRMLAGLLTHFEGDPLALAVRLCDDVQIAEGGHVFIGPLVPKLSIGFVLQQTRDAITLDELARRVRRVFGPDTPYPDADHLLEVLRDLDCRVQGEHVVPGRTTSIVGDPALVPDPLPTALANHRSPEVIVRDMLRDAALSRGFRMLVTPPQRHAEIGRSVAAAVGGTWLSFDDAFFADHANELRDLERAEQYVGQRAALTEAAEHTLFTLLERHGHAGKTLVLGDTALLGLCEALDLPRRLYDETLSGDRGFWVLIVPGVFYDKQPRFNEGPPMWHLEGATLPLLRPLPMPEVA